MKKNHFFERIAKNIKWEKMRSKNDARKENYLKPNSGFSQWPELRRAQCDDDKGEEEEAEIKDDNKANINQLL